MTARTRHASRHEPIAGFTLVELMVALTAGAFALMAIYSIGASSARHFQEQQRVGTAQTSLRLGLEQLRRDISRAGYLGVGWSQQAQRCVNPAVPVQAVEIRDGAETASLPNAGPNGVHADRLLLTGNYATADEYLIVGLDASGTQARLQSSWQAFRRSFLLQDGTFHGPSFDAAFEPGRVLRIRTQQGNHFFVTITDRRGGGGVDPRVTFSPALPVGGACTGGLADGATVAPLSRIEYRVMDLAATGAGASLAGRGLVPGAQGPQLVRREIGFATEAPLAQTERVVLDHVAHFDVDLFADVRPVGSATPVLQRFDDVAAQNLTQGVNRHRVRSVVVNVATRTPSEDPRLDPSVGYDVDPLARGAARIRRAETEILLPNLVE
ncbi:MAG: prepilin-type N-terminal cleavage/methylation domain-containing protein [Myxococcota bacterium]|nr:prepilin-type N-terminal cleavage/methylation domain-containing protein [Myxococcota bacterium]MDW8362385.1 prepilin-type N-terminal cleavage/methylation domain-containing protein [Myxococcales bacterium]